VVDGLGTVFGRVGEVEAMRGTRTLSEILNLTNILDAFSKKKVFWSVLFLLTLAFVALVLLLIYCSRIITANLKNPDLAAVRDGVVGNAVFWVGVVLLSTIYGVGVRLLVYLLKRTRSRLKLNVCFARLIQPPRTSPLTAPQYNKLDTIPSVRDSETFLLVQATNVASYPVELDNLGFETESGDVSRFNSIVGSRVTKLPTTLAPHESVAVVYYAEEDHLQNWIADITGAIAEMGDGTRQQFCPGFWKRLREPAVQLRKAKREERQVARLRERERLASADAKALCEIGRAYLQLGRAEDASRCANDARRLAPHSIEVGTLLTDLATSRHNAR
jgi:hypothetical protein